MKRILFFISFISLGFMQDDCSEITNPLECSALECEWITSYEQIGNELIIIEECSNSFNNEDEEDNNWEDECRYFESEDECIASGCEWSDEDGCYGNWDDSDGDDNWDDNENYCEGLTEDECSEMEGCQWYDGEGCYRSEDGEDNDGNNDWDDENPEGCLELSQDECVSTEGCEWIGNSPNMPGGGYCIENDNEDECRYFESEDECIASGCEWSDEDGCYGNWDDNENDNDGPPECLLDCEGIEYIDLEENPYETCDWIISNFGPNNFMNPCAEDCDNEIMMNINEYMEMCFQCLSDNNCDDIFDEEDDNFENCSDVNNPNECYSMGCEWIGGNMPGAGYCSEHNNEDCNPDLACAPVITCYEGLLYPTSCGPDNCDSPIGECEDNNDHDGLYECMMDCEGIDSVDPEEDLTYFCNWLFDTFPSGCAEDCEQGILDEIEEIMIACDECLASNNCNDNNCFDLDFEECLENSNCQPNYNAAGEYEGCDYYEGQINFGSIHGRVEIISGDVIDFISYGILHIESLPSNSDMYYFETMTDGEGYYHIELPVGIYMVTAYANDNQTEPVTLNAEIASNQQLELNFILGEWDGPIGPHAHLSLGQSHIALPGSEVTLPLYLSSTDFVGGVQFTLSGSDLLYPVNIESVDPCFSADFNMIDDGQIIGILFSLEGCEYPPEEMLEIAHLVFSITPYVPVGNTIDVLFNSTIISDAFGNEIPSYGEGTSIILGAKGDVNGDGEYNVLDVVMMVNFVLYIEYPNDSEFWSSDLNNDGMVNVLDVVQLVNLILE